jgi:sulfur carrier protein ThiS
MPQLKIPPPFRGPTRGRGRFEIEGRTVGECIERAGLRYPGLGDLLLDDEGRIHRYVTVFVNGNEIGRSALETALEDGDQLEILAAIAGG